MSSLFRNDWCWCCEREEVEVEYLNLSGQLEPWCWSCREEFKAMTEPYNIVIPKREIAPWELEWLGQAPAQTNL